MPGDGDNVLLLICLKAKYANTDREPNKPPRLCVSIIAKNNTKQQQAKNLAKNLNRKDDNWKTFQYNDKGSLAIIGRNKAVLDFPGQKQSLKGFVAWLIWIFVHIMGLVNFKNKVRTLYQGLSSIHCKGGDVKQNSAVNLRKTDYSPSTNFTAPISIARSPKVGERPVVSKSSTTTEFA